MELFLERFELETEAEHFSPAVKALFEAYDELLTLYERQDGKTLLQANRVAALEALEEEPEEFRRRADVFGHPPQPAAAAAPDPGGPNGPRGHNSRERADPTFLREAEMSGELKVLEALVMPPH